MPLWVEVSLYQGDGTETDRASLPRIPPCHRRCCPRGSIFRVPLVTPTACDRKADYADSLTGAMFIGALVSAMYDPHFFSALNIGVETLPRLYGLTTLQVWRVSFSPFPDVIDSDLQTYLYYVYYPRDSLGQKLLVSHSEYIHMYTAPHGILVYVRRFLRFGNWSSSLPFTWDTYLQGTWYPTRGAEYVHIVNLREDRILTAPGISVAGRISLLGKLFLWAAPNHLFTRRR